jgi:hypothetical protein
MRGPLNGCPNCTIEAQVMEGFENALNMVILIVAQSKD